MNDDCQKRNQGRGRHIGFVYPAAARIRARAIAQDELQCEPALAEDGVIVIYPPHARVEA